MYILNGIAYAGEFIKQIEVEKVFPLNDMMLLLTFNNGEKRLYDASKLLEYQAFQPLKDEAVFNSVRVEHGVIIWLDGEIDIAPEALYKNSFAYQEPLAG